MAEVKGLLKTCDRCGTMAFLKHIRTDSLDGGYTERDIYEAAPAGWGSYKVDGEYRTLCPACAERWEEIGTDFMEGRM